MKYLDESQARTIDARCKIFGTIAVVVGGMVGLVSYLDTRNNELNVRLLEASRPALEERLNLCVNLSTAAAKVATSDNSDEIKQAKKDFGAIFWGPLGLVESGDISASATEFNKCVEAVSPCKTSLPILSHNIALACRTSLGPNWGFPEPGAPTIGSAVAH
jgi:hypothetical protein